MGKTVKNNKSSWGRVPLGSVANEEVTSQTKSCPTATKMLTRHDFLRGLPSKRFRKIKNLTKGNNTSKNVFRNDVIVGRSVFKTPLHTHRRWHFHRQIFMDRNKKKSQVRITAFGELAHKLFHEVKFHGTYAIRNFTVKKPDRRFHQLKNPLEIHLNNQSEIIPILDDGKYPKDLISSFVPLNKINEIKDSCCIDVRGIVSNKTDCYTKFNYWSRSYWTALDIELVDNTNHSIQLTLPGQHALNFNTPVGGLYEISGVKIHVDIRVPESDDDEQEDDSSSTAEEEEADDENSTNDENEIDDEGNDGTRRKVNRVAKPKYIRSAKVMLCSDHQGDTDGNHDGASSDENSNDGATSSNSSSSDTDYDFDTVDDENEEEISDGSQPPPDELDSQNSISSLSSSHIISSASTYKNSNLLDEEAMELRRWYQETGSKIAHIPVPLCSTSQNYLQKLEYAKRILDKNKKKNPKYPDSSAAKEAAISPIRFCEYLKQFRDSRPRKPARPWLRQEGVKQLKMLIEENGGVQKMGMRKQVAESLGLSTTTFSSHLRSIGMFHHEQHKPGDKSHLEEGVKQLKRLIEENGGVEKTGMRQQVSQSLRLHNGHFSSHLHSIGMIKKKYHKAGDKSHFDEGVKQLKRLIEENGGVEKRGMRQQVSQSLRLHNGHFSSHLLSIGMKKLK